MLTARPKLPSWILPKSPQEGKLLTVVPSYDVYEHHNSMGAGETLQLDIQGNHAQYQKPGQSPGLVKSWILKASLQPSFY